MYLAYFSHYDTRPCLCQYLWVYYMVRDKLPDTYYILNEDYIRPFTPQQRWEMRVDRALEKGYLPPTIHTPENYTILEKAQVSYPDLMPSEVLRQSVKNGVKGQHEAIEKVLDNYNIKAGLLWLNNVAFKKQLNERNIPVIHNEGGALRHDVYRESIYFDFSGVNGNTEFDKRFKNFLKISDKVKILDRKELLKVISPKYSDELIKVLTRKTKPEYKIGVGMQVEMDTNLLIYNNGYAYFDVVLQARKECNNVLIRNHPCASVKFVNLFGCELDTSKNSYEFINSCENVYCMNSSVGLEAMLLGRKAKIFGQNPFKSLTTMDEETLIKALNFAIFGYQVPVELLFDDNYYSKRIEMGLENEEDLYNLGLEVWNV